MSPTPRKYRVLTGLNYTVGEGDDLEDKRVEVDDVIDDLPSDSVKWLIDGGYIEPVRKSKPGKPQEQNGDDT
jgi:hypothetical protein